ncbi:hypothetical protein V6N13_038385 [Hibiscus sabdariffa]
MKISDISLFSQSYRIQPSEILSSSLLSLNSILGHNKKVPCLRILRLLDDAYKGSKMIWSANGFHQLHSLEMDELEELEEWEIESAMPQLRSLCLEGISGLKTIPQGKKHITGLQQLKLTEMRTSLFKRVGFGNRGHIPHIQIIPG